MARKNDGASANPNTSTATPSDRNSKGAQSPAKISDVTDRGLYLWSRRTKQQARQRCHNRQKTHSIGPQDNGKDGTFSLAPRPGVINEMELSGVEWDAER